MTRCARAGMLCLPLLTGFALASFAQEAQVSFRAAPSATTSATPLFKVDVVGSPRQPAPTLPSLTVVETRTGPQLTNVAWKLPPVTIGGTAVTSQLGDQVLPRSFSASPWAGNIVKRPMRGVGFSTAGAAPVSVAVGQLDTGSHPLKEPPNTPGVVALAMGVTPNEEVTVTPRALIPIGANTTQTSVGTAIRAEVNRHVSFVSDVGAAGTAEHGWDPLAAAGVIGHWSGTELETSLLRGMSPVGTADLATVGSLDRETVRGLVRAIPGMTISAQATWSRPSSVPTRTDTTVGVIGVAYDRLPIGVISASRQDEESALRQMDTTRIEWKRKAVGGLVVRYVERQQTPRDLVQAEVVSKQVELELPGWIELDRRNRMDVRAVLTENPTPGVPTLSSRLTGRFDVLSDVGVSGDTELGLTGTGPTLRALRLTSSVPIQHRTAVQLVYTYQARGPFAFNNQSFEARLSRSISLLSW